LLTFIFLAQIFQCDHSAIWECVHRVSGQRYCVKIMNSQTQEAANEAVMFHAAQSHDNILSLVAIMEDEVEKKLYLISELMAGGNLLSRVVQQDGRLDTTTSNERQVQRLALQLLLGVQHLHETACVTHNDLNPANILLDTDDSLRIADFGSAEPIEYPSSSSAESSVVGPSTVGTLTAASSTLESSSSGGIYNNHGNNNSSNSSSIQAVSSSKCYRAPELLRPGAPSTSSKEADMWSVGVILYFCLFGPDNSLTHASLIDRIHYCSTEERSPAWNHQTSRHAKQFLSSLIHMDPSVRLTVDEALRHPWLEGVAPPPPQQQPSEPRRRRRGRSLSKRSSSQPHRSHRRMPSLRRSISRFASYFKQQQQQQRPGAGEDVLSSSCHNTVSSANTGAALYSIPLSTSGSSHQNTDVL